MSFKRTVLKAGAAIAALLACTVPASVHPHVFAEARLDVVLGPDHQTVKALRHLWRFDDLFSSTVLMEFDANADLKLDAAELQEVANTIHASLADFNYFQLVTVNGKDVKMKPPAAIMATFENNQLIILFESEPETPIQLAGDIRLGVYDPTFYTAIDFTEDANMAVEGLPSSCVRTVIRPDPDAALAENQQTLTEAFFNDPAGTDMSKIFATKLELKCHA
ncbi:DUF1007 family protein [Aquamicrobium sp. NLF2-7]|uniref:DUF1007 family protein n=1 Tax=Aquamicrobium sp. NLF2-7 TaxID=2918753 RepID=UPI001EFB209D|nr:DUF1007 family protein [Aquamicrobium sp. NLF2-7]MCG8271273.1 DUF1007 family protein [Aquamicrobium sp. NLF2-7]